MVTLCMQFICALFWGQDCFHSFRVLAGSHDFVQLQALPTSRVSSGSWRDSEVPANWIEASWVPGGPTLLVEQSWQESNSRLPTRLCPRPWSSSSRPPLGCSPAVPAPAHLHFLLRLRPFGPARLPSQMIPPRGGHRLHRRELEPPPGPVA